MGGQHTLKSLARTAGHYLTLTLEAQLFQLLEINHIS